MKGEIENKNHLNKMRKKIKTMRTKLVKIIYHKFRLKDKIKNKLNFYKKTKKRITNQNNEDQIEKYNTINLNWRMKLKINKILQKDQGKK